MEEFTKEQLFKKWESEFYDKFNLKQFFNEDFRSIALGFFIAKGYSIKDAREMYKYCVSKGKF